MLASEKICIVTATQLLVIFLRFNTVGRGQSLALIEKFEPLLTSDVRHGLTV